MKFFTTVVLLLVVTSGHLAESRNANYNGGLSKSREGGNLLNSWFLNRIIPSPERPTENSKIIEEIFARIQQLAEAIRTINSKQTTTSEPSEKPAEENPDDKQTEDPATEQNPEDSETDPESSESQEVNGESETQIEDSNEKEETAVSGGSVEPSENEEVNLEQEPAANDDESGSVSQEKSRKARGHAKAKHNSKSKSKTSKAKSHSKSKAKSHAKKGHSKSHNKKH